MLLFQQYYLREMENLKNYKTLMFKEWHVTTYITITEVRPVISGADFSMLLFKLLWYKRMYIQL